VRLVFDGLQLVIDPASLRGVPPGDAPAAQRADQGVQPRADRLPGHPGRRRGRLPGRGAYVHPDPACVTTGGLSRSFRRPIGQADLARIVSQVSPIHDNLGDQPLQSARQNAPGLADGDTVEMPPRIQATKKKDDRSEDARL
jgi:hypothetical protein